MTDGELISEQYKKIYEQTPPPQRPLQRPLGGGQGGGQTGATPEELGFFDKPFGKSMLMGGGMAAGGYLLNKIIQAVDKPKRETASKGSPPIARAKRDRGEKLVLGQDENVREDIDRIGDEEVSPMGAAAGHGGYTLDQGEDVDDFPSDPEFIEGDIVILDDSIGGGIGEVLEVSESGEGNFAIVELHEDQPEADDDSQAKEGDRMSVHISDIRHSDDDTEGLEGLEGLEGPESLEDSYDIVANSIYSKLS